MRKTTAKKLTLNKIRVAKLDTNGREVNAKAPTYTGCSLMAKCTPPVSKDTCF
ncbi:hypothetical protein CLV59_105437 [Chitinophaga dinghuensis]|uniref:Uncharacterized protein n=1 Tax=Chitinophaga dinghuensis TaxID=1539050 RepID=A0A327W5R6_9BACT|nr:hypothetical protein [Chitinophaga dinghuensis]RAJ80328.1 hypothetical protein CLV59_105437 [Chitinophaga dinghuensis]